MQGAGGQGKVMAGNSCGGQWQWVGKAWWPVMAIVVVRESWKATKTTNLLAGKVALQTRVVVSTCSLA